MERERVIKKRKKRNWKRLAAKKINLFQNQDLIIKRVTRIIPIVGRCLRLTENRKKGTLYQSEKRVALTHILLLFPCKLF